MWTLSWGAVLVAAGMFGVDIFKKDQKSHRLLVLSSFKITIIF